jgi:hypothetical protein
VGIGRLGGRDHGRVLLAGEVQRVAVEVVHVWLAQFRITRGIDAVVLLVVELEVERAQALPQLLAAAGRHDRNDAGG